MLTVLAYIDRLLNLGWDPARHPVVLMRKVRTLATMAVILLLVSIPFLVRASELIRAQHGEVVCLESGQGLTFVIRMPRLQR